MCLLYDSQVFSCIIKKKRGMLQEYDENKSDQKILVLKELFLFNYFLCAFISTKVTLDEGSKKKCNCIKIYNKKQTPSPPQKKDTRKSKLIYLYACAYVPSMMTFLWQHNHTTDIAMDVWGLCYLPL